VSEGKNAVQIVPGEHGKSVIRLFLNPEGVALLSNQLRAAEGKPYVMVTLPVVTIDSPSEKHQGPPESPPTGPGS
jgi:hypothetical protein